MTATLAILAALFWQMFPFPGPGRAASSYFVNEGFEGIGDPDGAGSAWTSSGTVDWDEAAVYHVGAQSLEIDSSAADGYVQITFAAADDIYGKFWFYTHAAPSTPQIVFYVYNDATMIARARVVNGTNALSLLATGGGTNRTMTLGAPADTWMRIWWHYTKGTGANATLRMWWATTDTHPGNGNAQYFAQSTDGTLTVQANAMRLYSDNAGTTNGSRYFDDVVVDNAILW